VGHDVSGTPAGWYQDPHDGSRLRWWDGAQWTVNTHEAPKGQAATAASPVAEQEQLEKELAELRRAVVETRDLFLLQEIGIYRYSHPLQDAAAYQDALKKLEKELLEFAKSGKAASGAKRWAINGSDKEGAKMVADITKLMLRAYNSEAEAILRSLKPYKLDSAKERLTKMRSSISSLGKFMQIQISDDFHVLRIKELELTADFLQKQDEEREREREERARLKEEEAARKEFEREQAKLEKERQHFLQAVAAVQAKGDTAAVADLQAKLDAVDEAIAGVARRAANTRAGYVYVISNPGSFGEGVVKIGLTRRLDPLDRVRELGDASVPFRFDVHAIIFSEDAVGLETMLHQRFAEFRVNLVNNHREFFRVSPTSVKEALFATGTHLLEFHETAEALEWRQSESARHSPKNKPISLPPPAPF
jgi:hypothetical protein